MKPKLKQQPSAPSVAAQPWPGSIIRALIIAAAGAPFVGEATVCVAEGSKKGPVQQMESNLPTQHTCGAAGWNISANAARRFVLPVLMTPDLGRLVHGSGVGYGRPWPTSPRGTNVQGARIRSPELQSPVCELSVASAGWPVNQVTRHRGRRCEWMGLRGHQPSLPAFFPYRFAATRVTLGQQCTIQRTVWDFKYRHKTPSAKLAWVY